MVLQHTIRRNGIVLFGKRNEPKQQQYHWIKTVVRCTKKLGTFLSEGNIEHERCTTLERVCYPVQCHVLAFRLYTENDTPWTSAPPRACSRTWMICELERSAPGGKAFAKNRVSSLKQQQMPKRMRWFVPGLSLVPSSGVGHMEGPVRRYGERCTLGTSSWVWGNAQPEVAT